MILVVWARLHVISIWMEAKFRQIKAVFKNLGADKVISTEIGPALAVHAGPSALVISVQNLDDGFNG